MQIVYRANHRGESWWPGTFERKRLTQHAILRRAAKHGMECVYLEHGRDVLLVCSGDATSGTKLAIDLEDEGILRFEILGEAEELAVFMKVASVPRFKNQAHIDVGENLPLDPARSLSPFEYDRDTLPTLVRDLVK